MANDPNRYAATCADPWNMGPFLVLVDGNDGGILSDRSDGTITLYRANRVGPHFFENAKAKGQIIRRLTITLRGEPA